MCPASPGDNAPSLRRSKVCSRQSSRDNLTVDATRNPSADQSCKRTSAGERGPAEVTAATITSAASTHNTRTGRSFEAVPLVKGISASQISPGNGIVVEAVVTRGVAVQERAVVAKRSWPLTTSLLTHPLLQPGGQFPEAADRKLLNKALNLFDFAHGRITTIRRRAQQDASSTNYSRMAGSP